MADTIEAAQKRLAVLTAELRSKVKAEKPLEVPVVTEETALPVQRYAVNSNGYLAQYYERTSRTGEQYYTFVKQHLNHVRMPLICKRWTADIKKQLREQDDSDTQKEQTQWKT
jgi:hypothetical protein